MFKQMFLLQRGEILQEYPVDIIHILSTSKFFQVFNNIFRNSLGSYIYYWDSQIFKALIKNETMFNLNKQFTNKF